MRQQGGDKSVSHCAVFGNTLASNDNGGFIWVKVSRATVEEQLAARTLAVGTKALHSIKRVPQCSHMGSTV